MYCDKSIHMVKICFHTKCIFMLTLIDTTSLIAKCNDKFFKNYFQNNYGMSVWALTKDNVLVFSLFFIMTLYFLLICPDFHFGTLSSSKRTLLTLYHLDK
jgi:hypothetical protein